VPGSPVSSFYPVQTIAGAAYFLDSQGTIRKLALTGEISVVGGLKLRSDGQPQISFAVSPDGAHVIASVFTWAPFVAGEPGSFGHFNPDSHWYYDLELLDPGQPVKTIIARDLGVVANQSQSWPTKEQTMVVGWDSVGPVATTNPQLAGQGRPLSPSLKTYGQHLVHLSADGTVGNPIGGSDCVPVDHLSNQTILCTDASWSSFSVRNSAGTVTWNRAIAGLDAPLFLSPDGRKAASRGAILTDGGSVIAFPGLANRTPALYVHGWLDATTVIGDDYGGLVLFDSTSPARGYSRIGTIGTFMGVV
jgi:hypothetical protein